MRVLLDCRSVFEGAGGIGRTTAALARHLPRAMPDDQLLLLHGSRRPEPSARPQNVEEVTVEAAMIDPVFEQVTLPGLIEDLNVDVYHGTCFAVPIATRVRRLATLHDVVFRRCPGLVDPQLRDYLDHWSAVSCDLADVVVTVSSFSAQEIKAVYGRQVVEVIPNAVDAAFFGCPRLRADPPFVLYAGALEEKKNVRALVSGFARLLERDRALPHRLILAGGQGGAALDVQSLVPSALRDRVFLPGRVSEQRLLELYGGASAFCYLSEYEGFGLPPLEAMAAGTPTLVSDRGSLPEVTQGASLVVDPHDPEAVANGLSRLLSNHELREQLIREGLEVARSYSWETSARMLAALYADKTRTLAA